MAIGIIDIYFLIFFVVNNIVHAFQNEIVAGLQGVNFVGYDPEP